ncbi:MAG TPA: glycosyltransferase [Mucilaginibacter sp.]|jgi:UDP:flavonoid glycosyltransferase YjiC (YdhE family)
MHYAIITYGSRGDVQPFIALALGLMTRGNKVTLLAPENFKDFVEGYGVTFYPLHGNAEALLYLPEGLRVLKTGNAIALLRYLQKGGKKILPIIKQDILKGSTNADALITSVLAIPWSRSIAEKLNIKWGIAQFNPPTVSTKEFPFAGLDFFNFPAYNLFTYWLLAHFYWQFNKKDVNEFRKMLGLTALKKPTAAGVYKENILNLYCFSPQLISRPNDWPGNTHITGYLTLPADSRTNHIMDQVPNGLQAWLQAGEKPIYAGFGSIPVPDAELFGNILNDILSKTNLRIIFCKGWSVIDTLTEHPNLFVVKYINHQWLFPQCKAAIIHGGAGTTAAVLKAKIPSIIVSVFADQPWWGKIIEEKKLGIHIPFKKLTTRKLLAAIEKTQREEMLKNVRETGERINNEDGLTQSITLIENYFA